MCRVSNKLKLCTCNTSTQHLPNYWILSRYDEQRTWYAIGMPMLPAQISPEDEAFNQTLLLSFLNDGNVFDTEIFPIDKDRLLLSFDIPEQHNSTAYRFEYQNGHWQIAEYDLFGVITHFNLQQGIIENPLVDKIHV